MIRLTSLLHSAIRLVFCTLLISVNVAYSAAESAAKAIDVRVLIDVSGSMKHNDPQNLRAPALRLLGGLLPIGTRAGIWTFGEKASNLVAVSDVDDTWKSLARQSAAKIHSNAPYTDIESALKAASDDWSKADGTSQRSIILLTDGLVDIAKDPLLSRQSRARIIDDTLVALRKKGVKIYPIALSDNADQELLRLLANGSGGWYEKAQTADALERLFLRMFEQVAKPETLPLTKNQVSVDDAISEVTFLVFSNRDADPVRLIAPDGSIIEASKVPASVRWHHENNHDLITVKEPQAGSWKLDAEIDPDNRALIVTNLKLVVTELPNTIAITDKIVFNAQLKQDDKTIDSPDLLRFVRVRLHQTAQKANLKSNIAIIDDGFAEDEIKRDGIYTGQLKEFPQADTYELVVHIDGTTFQRERRQIVNVLPAVAQANIAFNAQDSTSIDLVVKPHPSLINVDTLVAYAILTEPSGAKRTISLTKTNGSEQHSRIDGVTQTGIHKIDVNLAGTRINGEPISAWLETLTLEVKPIATTTPVTNTSTPTPAMAAVPATPQQAINWLYTGLKLAVFNVIFIATLFFAYRKWWPKINNPAEELAYD